MCRTCSVDLSGCTIPVISLEDLTARTARLALDLAGRAPTPSKHARDFLRLVELVNPTEMETAWLDHRKPAHPLTFKEAIDLLRDLIPARHDLLIAPEYSKDAEDVCLRCRNIRAFRLADPKIILSILGYC